MVGDDDQSIYAFRNAKPEYLIRFESMFENSQILKLEQNYRSCGHIINASNHVIKHNTVRNDKTMFTQREAGSPISYHVCQSPQEEAEWVIDMIQLHLNIGFTCEEIAILYRKNLQSRLIEQALLEAHIPYTTLGVSFYERAVIKDLLAFFKLKQNKRDDISFRRVCKQLPGVGEKTVKDLLNEAKERRIGPIKLLKEWPFRKAQQKLINDLLQWLKTEDQTLVQAIDFILRLTLRRERLESRESEESQDELELISEFYQLVQSFEANGNHSLDDFLTTVSLQTDRSIDESGVTLMTIHSSKGLEFNTVFLIGTEESILPSERSLKTLAGLEEERRLMYVAMTRAQENLYITSCEERSDFSSKIYSNRPSRFLSEIPSSCLLEM